MELQNYKAGEKKKGYEYAFFMPNHVNHEWIISDQEILLLNSQADRSLGELNAFTQLVPDIDFIIKMYMTKEATLSSRIEGTQTNIEDAFKDLQDIEPEQRDDWSEVQNYIAAINYAIQRLDDLPVSNRLLQETHKVLMRGVRGQTKQPGEFRNSQNWIGVSLRNAVFIPPHQDHVIDLMSDLEKFLHNQEINLPPLIKIAIAHYQFETIHPFLDGNGRLGRLMISLILASDHHLCRPSLYLSDYFERNKTAYVDHLMAVREGNHMKEWLIFFLAGVQETAQNSIELFKQILVLKQTIEQEILPHFSKTRQGNVQNLMRYLYSQPIVDNKMVQKYLSVSKNTAASLIRDLISHDILVELTGQRRNQLFLFNNYLKLFI